MVEDQAAKRLPVLHGPARQPRGEPAGAPARSFGGVGHGAEWLLDPTAGNRGQQEEGVVALPSRTTPYMGGGRPIPCQRLVAVS
jgi:hypothetical protein